MKIVILLVALMLMVGCASLWENEKTRADQKRLQQGFHKASLYMDEIKRMRSEKESFLDYYTLTSLISGESPSLEELIEALSHEKVWCCCQTRDGKIHCGWAITCPRVYEPYVSIGRCR